MKGNLAAAQKEESTLMQAVGKWLFFAKAFTLKKGHWHRIKMPNTSYGLYREVGGIQQEMGLSISIRSRSTVPLPGSVIH